MARVSASRRLLIVEDEATQAAIMAEILEDAGYEIVGPVRNIREAMRIVAHDYFDAALLDVQLDGELSLTLALALRRRDVPVLFVTGHADPRLAGGLDGSAYLAKPYGVDQLVQNVNALFAVPSAADTA